MLNGKAKQIARVAHFFFNQQNNKLARAARIFVFLCRCFARLQRCLCTTKTSNFLVTHYFYGGIVVCAYPIFCFLCSCSLLFFTAAHFHLAGRQHFSFSHRRFEFSCFSSYKIRSAMLEQFATIRNSVAITLQSCDALKIVVANRTRVASPLALYD